MKAVSKKIALLESWNSGALPGRFCSAASSAHSFFAGTTLCCGRICLRLVASGLIAAGCFALFQCAVGHFLSHDLRYVGMNTIQLCGIGEGRVALFMFHDRASFGGSLIAIGVLYLWLEQIPLKTGESWAWWTFLISGLAGFGSFLAYLGYGYLDSWHGLATLALLPFYAGGLTMTRRLVLESSAHSFRNVVPSSPAWRTRLGFGRWLLLATAAGLVVGGTTVLLVGMTRVFVPQDLQYLGLGASDLLAINRRLVPLIAHDRAAFGGATATSGLLLFYCVWFGRPSRGLWRAVALAGGAGFFIAIGVHPLIRYNDISHLAPAYLGALIFSVGISLCHRPMCAGDLAASNHPCRVERAMKGLKTLINTPETPCQH